MHIVKAFLIIVRFFSLDPPMSPLLNSKIKLSHISTRNSPREDNQDHTGYALIDFVLEYGSVSYDIGQLATIAKQTLNMVQLLQGELTRQHWN